MGNKVLAMGDMMPDITQSVWDHYVWPNMLDEMHHCKPACIVQMARQSGRPSLQSYSEQIQDFNLYRIIKILGNNWCIHTDPKASLHVVQQDPQFGPRTLTTRSMWPLVSGVEVGV